MSKPNGCSTPAPRSSAAKQWFEQLSQKKKNNKEAEGEIKVSFNNETLLFCSEL